MAKSNLPKFDHNQKREKIHPSHEMKFKTMQAKSFEGSMREFFAVDHCVMCEAEESVGVYSYHCDRELKTKCKF